MSSDKSILIIDDAEAMSGYLSTLLSAEGFSALCAQTAEEGLRRLRERAPDMIILDVILPDMDGRQFCQFLKSDPRTRLIPIMMCTASARTARDTVEGLRAGADDYLGKPFQAAELLERVHALLRRMDLAEERARAVLAEERTREARRHVAAADIAKPESVEPHSPAAQSPSSEAPAWGARALIDSVWLALAFPSEAFARASERPLWLAATPVAVAALAGSLASGLAPTSQASAGAAALAFAVPFLLWAVFGGASAFALTLLVKEIDPSASLKAWGLAAAPIAWSRLLALAYVWAASGDPSDFSASLSSVLAGVEPGSPAGVCLSHCDAFEWWAAILAARGLERIAGVPAVVAAGAALAAWSL
ncbi:MAG: response regulator, partial [Elusimicrobia bacterium]|nr:response regulator [Elusimicrobiota bacterium]